MKTAAEVLGELLIGCLRALTPEERENLYVKNKFQGKTIQFTLPDEHEICVAIFNKEKENWLIYERYSNPVVTCNECDWQGRWDDLNVYEKPMDLTGKVAEMDLFVPIKKIVIEKCVQCGSLNLKYKDWEHDNANLMIKGSFSDIAAVAEMQVGGIFHKIKALFGVFGALIKKRVSLKPFRRLGTAIKVSKLITGKVAEDYKED